MTRSDATDVLNLLGDELGESVLQGLSLGGGSVASGSDRGLTVDDNEYSKVERGRCV